MVRSLQELQNDLHRIQMLLHQEAFLSLSDEERRRLLDDSSKLVQKLQTVAESYLVVGLLGGTGVGKSSLMNALACAPIAAASHRRPHTDQVLVYRHAGAPLPTGLDDQSFPWGDHRHEVEAIRQIILCDLPDFDSLLTTHREQVLSFLEHLDILVWVASPEKYADERFYAFLQQVPKARRNFYFVLNKVDLLFSHPQVDTGYSELARLTTQFSRHLQNHGISQPVIYAVSARESGGADTVSPWNHLWNFRNQVFRLRDAKELTGIKAANLDVEVGRFGQILEKEVFALKTVQSVLVESLHESEGMRSEWRRVGDEVFQRAFDKSFKEAFLRQPVPPGVLVGVGHALAVALTDWRRFTNGSDEVAKVRDHLLNHQTLQPLQQELERVRNRIIYKCLQRGLPSLDQAGFKGLSQGDREYTDFSIRLQEAVTRGLEAHGTMSVTGFRGVQYASYLLLFALLILGVIGETPWRSLFEQPSWYALIAWASTVIRTLFSPDGLAALGSYVLLQLLLGVRFYGRYKKLLQRHAQKFIESLKLELGRVWEEELNILIAHLRENAQQIQGRLVSLSALSESGSEV